MSVGLTVSGEHMQEIVAPDAEKIDDGISLASYLAPRLPSRLNGPEVGAGLRRFRRARGHTLRQVAEATGTTPQTIHRLESGGMTLSVDWLLKICEALEIQPTSLFQSAEETELSVMAMIDVDAEIRNLPDHRHEAITLSGSIGNVFGVRVENPVGSFEAGDILIAAPANPYPPANRDWGPCLIQADNEAARLCHVFQTAEGRWITVAMDRGGPSQFSASVTWLARIVTVVRYLPEIQEASALEHVDRAFPLST